MAVNIPSYTKAGLPNTPAAGDLARVTDSVQGAWMADGATQASWFSLTGEIVNVRDFGAVGDGVTNDGPAIQQAIDDATGIVYLPPGTYASSIAIDLKPQLMILGAGYQNSAIKFTGATRGLVYEPSIVTEAQIRLSGFRIIGNPASTLDLLCFKNAAVLYFDQLNVRDTTTRCLCFETCFNTFMNQLRIENYGTYGIHLGPLTNVWSILGCDFQGAATGGGTASVYIEQCGFGGVRDSNFEGNGNSEGGDQVAIRLNGAANVEIAANFMEFYRESAIDFREVRSRGIRIALNALHIMSVGNVIETGGVLENEGVIIEQNRIGGANGSNCYLPAGTTSYTYRMNSKEESVTMTDVVGFTESEVETGPSAVRQKKARLLNEGIITGATPSIQNLQYVEVKNTSPVTMTGLTNGDRDQVVILRFEDGNTTVQSGGNFRLAGKVNKTFAPLDTLTLLNVGNNVWVEVGRSIN